MPYNELLKNNPQDLLIGGLASVLQDLFIFTGDQVGIDLKNYSTILVDYKQTVENSNIFELKKLIDDGLASGKNLILINVHDSEKLSKMIGIGLESK